MRQRDLNSGRVAYSRFVPRLIHLNGPPGIGKSTLAQWYVDNHPGVLNLDIDQVRCLIGGWRERFVETGELARPIALAMASAHLRAGLDVVMPQYLGRLGEIERFEAVAQDSGAELSWHREVQELVDRNGGLALLADMYDRLIDVLRSRPAATVVPSHAGSVQQTYEALAEVVDKR